MHYPIHMRMNINLVCIRVNYTHEVVLVLVCIVGSPLTSTDYDPEDYIDNPIHVTVVNLALLYIIIFQNFYERNGVTISFSFLKILSIFFLPFVVQSREKTRLVQTTRPYTCILIF